MYIYIYISQNCTSSNITGCACTPRISLRVVLARPEYPSLSLSLYIYISQEDDDGRTDDDDDDGSSYPPPPLQRFCQLIHCLDLSCLLPCSPFISFNMCCILVFLFMGCFNVCSVFVFSSADSDLSRVFVVVFRWCSFCFCINICRCVFDVLDLFIYSCCGPPVQSFIIGTVACVRQVFCVRQRRCRGSELSGPMDRRLMDRFQWIGRC
jgi:hypothetical protein